MSHLNESVKYLHVCQLIARYTTAYQRHIYRISVLQMFNAIIHFADNLWIFFSCHIHVLVLVKARNCNKHIDIAVISNAYASA